MTIAMSPKKKGAAERAYDEWRRYDKKYQRGIRRNETAHLLAYFVPSTTTPEKEYEVILGDEESCECGAFRYGGDTCVHLYLASFYHAKIGRKNDR